MKFDWNGMDASQKKETIVLIVMSVISLIFIILDVTGAWANNISFLALSILSLYEGIMGWNRNRKWAILELIAAVFLTANIFIS